MTAPASRRAGPVAVGFFSLLPLGAAAGAMVAPVLLALAGLLNVDFRRLREDVAATPGPLWLVLAFAAWAAASSFWSPFHNHGQALRLWGTLLPGLLFIVAAQRDASSRRWTRAAGIAAVVALIALLALEALYEMPLNRAFNHTAPTWQIERNPGRGVSILLAMVWAVSASLIAAGAPRRWIGLALLAAAGVLSAQFEDYANLAAFALGLIAFAAGAWLPRLATLLVTWSLAAWLLAAPFVTPLIIAHQKLIDALPYSWAARMGIWRYVCGRIAAQPVIGSGMDASRAVTDTITVRDVTMRAVQLHPHSGSLQIWFESGGVAAVIAACALLWSGWSMSRVVATRRAQAAAICATFAALGAIANISYGIWQEWWDATLLIGACLLMTMGRPSADA
ncbi:MAG: hypothetical protein QM759_15060 [Terricaulis sp.]